VDPASATITSQRQISMSLTAPVASHSVRPAQFSVTAYTHKHGWSTHSVADTRVDDAGTTVVLDLKSSITTGQTVRLIAHGTGPHPILGTDLVPLAGVVGGPPGSADDGHDFVIMLRRS
jgi:hypothetical protein